MTLCESTFFRTRHIATLQPHTQTAQRVCQLHSFFNFYSQLQTLNHRLLPANVFLCIAASARYRGSGSIEPKGLTVSRKAAFGEVESRKVCETATLILSEPLRLRHLPYPRYRAAEEDIACLHDFTVSLPYSQPQTLNHRLLPANVFPCVAASARYRGSGSIEPKGLTVSRKAALYS